MQYVNLGKTGLKVSSICLGTDNFGRYTEAEESTRIMAKAAEAGINFIDTADSYADTVAEEIVGRFIKSRRHEFVVCSKGYHRTGPGPNGEGNSRKHIMKAVEGSLKRLGTDYIDVYLLHYYDYQTDLEESVRTMDELVRSGKVRYIGCSNFAGHQLTKALWIADAFRGYAFAVAQTRYNLLNREPELELLPACKELGVGVTAYSVQAGGMLFGKHKRTSGGVFEAVRNTRMAETSADKNFYRNAYWNEWCFEAVEALKKVADAAGVALASLAVQWVRSNSAVSSCIVGARTISQIESNLKHWNADVPQEVLEQATAVADKLLMEGPWRGVVSQPLANKPVD